MGKATKKSQDPRTDVSPSTSGTVTQKPKSRRKPKTPSKKNGGEISFCFRNPNKVRKTIKKGKKTPPPRALKRKASEKTAKKTKNVIRKAMYGHYQDLVKELARTETDPDHSSLGSSTASITDMESQ
ncbi:aspartate, glycine, lysine and serine-rich protein-like [Microtus oregoni]|nr:aspartate, glycine, lysine and serine-rich protein-like [Microtus oregoni]